MVTINRLIEITSEFENKTIFKKHLLNAPTGVRGRNSSNTLIKQVLVWDYEVTLREGLKKTYSWISDQITNELKILKS